MGGWVPQGGRTSHWLTVYGYWNQVGGWVGATGGADLKHWLWGSCVFMVTTTTITLGACWAIFLAMPLAGPVIGGPVG